jgi:hypothetical protein
MIIFLILMLFMATLATDSLRWGLGITLFMVLAMVSMYWALIIFAVFLVSLFLVQYHS